MKPRIADKSNPQATKARIVSYDKKLGEFARKAGVIQIMPNGPKMPVDSLTMPQGWKIGTMLDVTIRNNEVVRIQVSYDQEIDLTQEGLI